MSESDYHLLCVPHHAADTPVLLLLPISLPVDDLSTGSSDYAANSWILWFLSTKGNEYFCEVDEDYILDRFNLTGLSAEVQYYPQALDLITDAFEDEIEDESRDQIEAQARLLYGLVHARYIVTTRGLAKMVSGPAPSFLPGYSLTCPCGFCSSTSTRGPTLADARGCYAISTHFSPLVSRTFLSKRQSSSTVRDAKTFTVPKAAVMERLMAPSLEAPSLTCL